MTIIFFGIYPFCDILWMTVEVDGYLKKPYVIQRGGQGKTLLTLTRVGTWSKRGQIYPYIIKE